MLVYLNGGYVPRVDARIAVDDRGFMFGDGVYEVIRSVNGRLFAAEEHLERMQYGLAALGIRVPAEITSATMNIAEHLLRENDLLEGESTVYIQITRGAAPRTHHFPPADTPPTIYLATAAFIPPAELRGEGAAAIIYPDIRWSRCNLKTVNLLPNVLAKQHAVEAGAAEAILMRDGVVTEGSSTNVFGVIDGQIRTYPTSNYILPGITREVVLELSAALGHTVVEGPLLLEDLRRLDELFLTGTTTDVLPIVRLDRRPVADGRPGPVTMALQKALAKRMGRAVLAKRVWGSSDFCG